MIVFLFAGHRPPASDRARTVLLPRLVSLALLGILAVYLTVTFERTIAWSVLETGVRKTLAGEVVKFPGARLVDLTLGSQQGTTTAWAVIRTP